MIPELEKILSLSRQGMISAKPLAASEVLPQIAEIAEAALLREREAGKSEHRLKFEKFALLLEKAAATSVPLGMVRSNLCSDDLEGILWAWVRLRTLEEIFKIPATRPTFEIGRTA